MTVGDPSLIKAIIVSIQIVLEVDVIIQFFTTAAIDKCELGQPNYVIRKVSIVEKTTKYWPRKNHFLIDVDQDGNHGRVST